MNGETFEIVYDGTAVRDHGMDVHDLAPALLAIGDLIREGNSQLNGGRTAVKVFVRPDFEHKCFQINLELIQTFLEQARNLLEDENVRTAKEVLEWLGIIGGVAGAVVGVPLLTYLRLRNGRKLERVSETADEKEGGFVTVHFEGDANHVTIHNSVYKLGENPAIKDAADQMFSPLGREGYETLETRKNGVAVEKFGKDDANAIRKTCGLGLDEPTEEFAPQSIIAHLQVYSPVFDPESNVWRFQFGGDTIRADISETSIAQEAIERGSVSVGDTYKVELEITEYLTHTRQLRKRYKILEVLDFTPAEQQPSLF